MSLLKSEDSHKWLNGFCALCSLLSGYVLIRLINQCGEWFDLEAKIPNFLYVTQAFGVVAGFGVFIYLLKSTSVQSYLNEAYGELLKVVLPKKDLVSRITFGLVIALTIVSCIFVGVDFVFGKLIKLILV